MYDVLIENARIVDGRGNPWYGGSIAIAGGRIAVVGRKVEGEARERVDARGMYACPGLIDTHTHSDVSYFVDGTAQSKVRQGVTTEVTGNCGMSAAPALGAARSASLAFEAVPTWASMAEYLASLDATPRPVNIAPLVGHGTLRLAAVGRDDRPATGEEMAAMERLLAESLQAGAFGMSTGLYFAPGMYAPTEELVCLLRIAARHGALMASHIRDEGTYTVGFIAAVQEIISLGRASGCPVHFSHMKAHGPEVWGTSTRVLEMIEAARAEGIEVSLDQYPYEASGGGMVPDSLPHSFQAGRSPEQISADLGRPEVRAELHDIVAANIARRGGAERLFVSTYPAENVIGKSIAQLAREMGSDPANVVMDLLAEGGGASAGWTCFSMHPDDVDRFMQFPGTMIGSDGSALSTEGALSGGNPHPRNFGTFARILGYYVRDRGVLRLEDAVRKMTSLPAQTFGIAGRGALQEGHWADVMLFDLQQVTDATFENPKCYAEGIPYVMVNGTWVIREGMFTGRLPGQALRHGTPRSDI
jgi:N-acyl-D-amino-acid deacylase